MKLTDSEKLQVLQSSAPRVGQDKTTAVKRLMSEDPKLTFHHASQLYAAALKPPED